MTPALRLRYAAYRARNAARSHAPTWLLRLIDRRGAVVYPVHTEEPS